MSDNQQMRKVQLTINNYKEAGLDAAAVDTLVAKLQPQYYCRSEEIGAQGTRHMHIALYRPSPIRFRTLKALFPMAHIEKAHGTMEDNRAYVAKTGKWADTDKAETSVPGTFAEFGVMPTERAEQAPKMGLVLDMLRQGATTTQILNAFPDLAMQTSKIDTLRETLRADEVEGQMRDPKVFYLYGATGTGKTRSIYNDHPAKDICRITTYGVNGNPTRFDAYHGQKVLVFEEFRGQIPISAMLSYLDHYPLQLPARYSDRVARYDTVYMTSNDPPECLYPHESPETRRAFLRRIHHIKRFEPDGTIVEVKNSGRGA